MDEVRQECLCPLIFTVDTVICSESRGQMSQYKCQDKQDRIHVCEREGERFNREAAKSRGSEGEFKSKVTTDEGQW